MCLNDSASLSFSPVVTVGFFPAEYTVQEKTEVVFLTIKVLEGSLGRSASVIFSTNSGTATEDVDYVHMDAEEIVFGAGETVHMIRVTIINDNLQEDHELFEALLNTSDDAVILDPAVAPITIIEDSDGEPRLLYTPSPYPMKSFSSRIQLFSYTCLVSPPLPI